MRQGLKHMILKKLLRQIKLSVNFVNIFSPSSVSWAGESNGSVGAERLSHSLPGSPADRKPNFEVIGSAESLVGRVRIFSDIDYF